MKNLFTLFTAKSNDLMLVLDILQASVQ